MNNKFDFGRFGQVFSLDLKRCVRNFGTSFIVMWCIPIVFWIPTLVFHFSMPVIFRFWAYYITVYIACIIAPSKVFRDINLRREGIGFAMLPASTLEKYLSYAICCLLIPIVVFLGGYAVDSLLALLPFGGFDGFGDGSSLSLVNSMNQFMADPNTGVWQMDSDLSEFFDVYGEYEIPNLLVNGIFMVAFFMFGNLLLRFRNKAGLSFLILMGFTSIISVISRIFLFTSGSLTQLMNGPSVEAATRLVSQAMWLSIITYSVLTIALYVASYFRMKSLKY